MSFWSFCWRSCLALMIIGIVGALAIKGMFWLTVH